MKNLINIAVVQLGTSNNLLRKPDRLLRCSAYSPYASAPQIRCGPLATVIRSSQILKISTRRLLLIFKEKLANAAFFTGLTHCA